MNSDWQRNFCFVKDRNGYLLEKGIRSDCSFVVGEGTKKRKVLAHKFILSNASPVFETMFYGSLAEVTNKAIEITDIEPRGFANMLKYIYTDSIEIDEWAQAIELYCAAKKYMLDYLAKKCIEYLTKQLSASSAFETYEFAKFYEETDLLNAALEVIKRQTVTAIESPYFLSIDISTMVTILEQDTLNVSETKLFEALEMLAKHKGIISDNESSLCDASCSSKTIKKASKTNSQNELKSHFVEEFYTIMKRIRYFSLNPKDTLRKAAYKVKQLNKSSENILDMEQRMHLFEEFRIAVKKIRFLSMTPKEFSAKAIVSKLLMREEAFEILVCLNEPLYVNSRYPKDFIQAKRLNFKPPELEYEMEQSKVFEFFKPSPGQIGYGFS